LLAHAAAPYKPLPAFGIFHKLLKVVLAVPKERIVK